MQLQRARQSVAISVLVMFAPLAMGNVIKTKVYTLDADFDEGILNGVNHEIVHDQLQLNFVPVRDPFAWIANSGDATVSKIDTAMGVEVARYKVGPYTWHSPSRTAVDGFGNCFVANRAFGQQGSLVKLLNDGGIDRNGNGVIDTSTGPADVKPWPDERVAFSVDTRANQQGDVPRALAIDRQGRVWLGLFNARRFLVLEPGTGAVLASVETTYNPYGAAMDGNGILWCVSFSDPPLVGYLESINTNNGVYLGARQIVTQSGTHAGYGIAIDRLGQIWIGAYPRTGVVRFDPVTGTFTHFPAIHDRGRGVTIDPEGNIWVASGYQDDDGEVDRFVAKFSPDGSLITEHELTGPGDVNPCGVGTDPVDGHIIVVCQGAPNAIGTVQKLNRHTGERLWHLPIGRTPYTYSDFTGFLLRYVLLREGFWNVVYDSGRSDTRWGKVWWNSYEPAGTSVRVRVRAAHEKAQLASKEWLTVQNNQPFGLLNGRYLEVEVRLATEIDESPILYDLSIKSALKPPDGGCVAIKNLIPGDLVRDPAGGTKRSFRPGTLAIDEITIRDVLLANCLTVDEKTIVQAAMLTKYTPEQKCTAFVRGPGSGLNTNFTTGWIAASNLDLDKPLTRVVLKAFGGLLRSRSLLYSPPGTLYQIKVVYVTRLDNGRISPPKIADVCWIVLLDGREDIRYNIEYFSTVAAGATQKPKIDQEIAQRLLTALEITDPLEALIAFETVVASSATDFSMLRDRPDARFLKNYLVDSDEEPIGCLLIEQANALLWR